MKANFHNLRLYCLTMFRMMFRLARRSAEDIYCAHCNRMLYVVKMKVYEPSLAENVAFGISYSLLGAISFHVFQLLEL